MTDTDPVFPENLTPEGRARIEAIAIFCGMMRILPTIIEMDWDKVVRTLESAQAKLPNEPSIGIMINAATAFGATSRILTGGIVARGINTVLASIIELEARARQDYEDAMRASSTKTEIN